MKVLKLMPIGAALFALGLGLSSVAPVPAMADDEDSGTRTGRVIIRSETSDSESGYLGVQVQRLTASLRRAKGIPESIEGTLVSGVEEGGPADDGGIKRGDLILKVNREETPAPSDLVQTVRGLEPGKRVPVQIWRDGVTRTVNLTVSSRPEGSDFRPPRPPQWEGDDSPGAPGEPRMQILRRNRGDLERQVQELKEQLAKLRNEDLARLEREVRELREDLRRQNDQKYRNRDNNRDRDDRDDNRDRDNSEDD